MCEIITKKWCVVIPHPRSRYYFNILSPIYGAPVPQMFPKFFPKPLLSKWGTVPAPKPLLSNWGTVPIPQTTLEELGNYSRSPKSF